jgi:hypothetical protein
MKFCAINSNFSLRENVAMKMNAVKEMKHMDWAKTSITPTSTMLLPIGRGSSTRTQWKYHGRRILDTTQATNDWAAIL